ncbi:hypothetical protein T484DRAFT_2274321 [Baffinella frigidus]|nr:hypothetical protein T484DRAFT_2274321 [Cryptophyta sp. CCMP2293]
MRYAGPGTFGSRRIVDEYEQKLGEANSKCEKNRKRYDKMARLLVNAKAGIEHLAERLENVKLQEGGKLDMSDETVLEILTQCERKLERTRQAGRTRGPWGAWSWRRTMCGCRSRTGRRRATTRRSRRNRRRRSRWTGRTSRTLPRLPSSAPTGAPKPYTPNINPKHKPLNPKHSTLNPKP